MRLPKGSRKKKWMRFWPKYRKKNPILAFHFQTIYHFYVKKKGWNFLASFFTWKFLNISCRDTNLWVWWLRFLRSRIWKRKHKRKFYEHYLDSIQFLFEKTWNGFFLFYLLHFTMLLLQCSNYTVGKFESFNAT